MKLLIPSVSGYHDKPEGYLYPRITALYAQIINVITIKANGGPKINWKIEELSQTWGKFNRASAKDYEIQLKRAKSCKNICEIPNLGRFHNDLINVQYYYPFHCKC